MLNETCIACDAAQGIFFPPITLRIARADLGMNLLGCSVLGGMITVLNV